METLSYAIDIDASPESVWKVLWEDETYRNWTSFFAKGSYAESDWEQGSKAKFFDGEGNGLICRVDVHVPRERMVFKHLSAIEKGEEVPLPEAWEGGQESYVLTETESGVRLQADTDSMDEYIEYFNDVFPKALERVKELAEA